MIIPSKGCHVHAQSNIISGLFVYIGGIAISYDSGVVKYQKEVGREEREE